MQQLRKNKLVSHHTMQWIWGNAEQVFPHLPLKILLFLYAN